ncbi:MAG: hypothetical protein AAF597_09650 [Bacteroidota bacterium]
MSNKDKEQLPDVLTALKRKGDGFSSPDAAYFEAMADRAIQEAQKPAVRRALSRNWLAVAASVLVLVFAGWWLLNAGAEEGVVVAKAETRPSSDELLAEISIEDIDAYVSEQIDEFTLELYDQVPLKE